MQYPRKKFLSSRAAGHAARFFGVAFLARIYGQQMIGFFSRHDRPSLYLVISLAVTAGIGAVARHAYCSVEIIRIPSEQ